MRSSPAIALATFTLLATILSAPATELWIYEWEGGIEPQKHHSLWAARGSGSHSLLDGKLLIRTEDDENMLFSTCQETSHGLWNGGEPVVVEFAAQALEAGGPGAGAAHLAVSDGHRRAVVVITDPELHVYRLELQDGHARLLISGEEMPEQLIMLDIAEDDPHANGLYFGDDSGAISGASLWHFIRWRPLP